MARLPTARLTYAISLTPCAWLVRVSLSKRLNEKRMGEEMRKRNSFAPSPIVFLVLHQLFTIFCVAVSLNTNKETRQLRRLVYSVPDCEKLCETKKLQQQNTKRNFEAHHNRLQDRDRRKFSVNHDCLVSIHPSRLQPISSSTLPQTWKTGSCTKS